MSLGYETAANFVARNRASSPDCAMEQRVGQASRQDFADCLVDRLQGAGQSGTGSWRTPTPFVGASSSTVESPIAAD